MQTSLPLWVAIVLGVSTAVAAIISAVITQIATAVIDRRKRNHEKGMTDEKWKREQADREAQWRREDEYRWSRDRFAAYARFISACEAWLGGVKAIAITPRILPSTETLKNLNERTVELAESRGSVSLLGSSHVQEAAKKFLGTATVVNFQANGWMPEQDPRDVVNRITELQDELKILISGVREDLGLPDEKAITAPGNQTK